jgi:hypothetical protein
MNAQTQYRQCRLGRPLPNGRMETTSYLPALFARVGAQLRLKDEDGNWVSGWEVLQAGPLVDEPPDWRKLIKGHRKMTGDSMPRGG